MESLYENIHYWIFPLLNFGATLPNFPREGVISDQCNMSSLIVYI